jgi:hypothetical protein
MYYIGLDVHKKTISYCIKDVSGRIHREGTIGANRNELDRWMTVLPQPWTVAMEATIFTGWIYDHLQVTAFRSVASIKRSFPPQCRPLKRENRLAPKPASAVCTRSLNNLCGIAARGQFAWAQAERRHETVASLTNQAQLRMGIETHQLVCCF